jgi:hypothetical protein
MLTPANDKITVKKRVDKPMMAATVPSNESLSFHKFTKMPLIC